MQRSCFLKPGLNFPSGLIFWKYFYNASSLVADFSVGNPSPQYSSVSGIPDLSGGYHVSKANLDKLSYENAGNCSASEETIIFGVVPSGLTSVGHAHVFTSDVKNRLCIKYDGGITLTFRPNQSDSSACFANYVTGFSDGVLLIASCVCKHNSPYARLFFNGFLKHDDAADDFISPAWGSRFYVGCGVNGTEQLEGVYKFFGRFNRALTNAEHFDLYNMLK